MKVAVLSSASAGGAGIAAYRIYEALSESSELEVDFFDIGALGQVDLSVSPTHSASNGKITNTHFTVDYATEPRQWVIDFLSQYDVLNIQWASYLLSLCEIHELAKRGKKILFTLHDFHYITGGCHYPAGCLGFMEGCVGCPQVDERKCDLHTVIDTQKLKRKIFAYENVHLAAPSAFIVNNAIRSGIVPEHRAHVLRNAYQPIEPFEPRDWGNKRSILLIADSFDEQRKGLQLAVDSLKLAFSSEEATAYDLELHLVGGMDTEVINQLDGLPVRILTHGHIKEHKKLVQIFKQCQFILTCSYEDNWPNILVEAGSYGCVPIVGKWHGCEEFVDTFHIGFKAKDYQPHYFSEALIEALFSHYGLLTSNLIKEFARKTRDKHSHECSLSSYYSAFNANVLEQHYSPKKQGNTLSINYALSIKYLFNGSTTISEIPSPFQSRNTINTIESILFKNKTTKNTTVSSHAYGISNYKKEKTKK